MRHFFRKCILNTRVFCLTARADINKIISLYNFNLLKCTDPPSDWLLAICNHFIHCIIKLKTSGNNCQCSQAKRTCIQYTFSKNKSSYYIHCHFPIKFVVLRILTSGQFNTALIKQCRQKKQEPVLPQIACSHWKKCLMFDLTHVWTDIVEKKWRYSNLQRPYEHHSSPFWTNFDYFLLYISYSTLAFIYAWKSNWAASL